MTLRSTPSLAFDLDGLITQLTGRRWDYLHRSLDRCFDLFFSAYVFVTIFLPTGVLYHVNFKLPLYVGLLPLSLYTVFHRERSSRLQLTLLFAVPTILMLWIVIAMLYGFDTPTIYRQYSDALLTLLMCWLASLFWRDDQARYERFLRLVVNASIATAALKVGLVLYALVRGIPVVQVVLWLDTLFGADLMTMDLGAIFGRIQFIADELIPVCIFVLLRHRQRLGFGNVRAFVALMLLMLSVVISFSRYFWGFAACALLLGLLLGKKDRFQVSLLSAMGVIVVATLPLWNSLFALRFFSSAASGSDNERFSQVVPLQKFFLEAPLLGHGLGSFTTVLLRDQTLTGRFAYEMQILALPAQLGILGITFFLLLGAMFYQRLWRGNNLNWADRIGIVGLLLFWIAAGATNPLLLHPVAGINYAALAALSALPSRKAPQVYDQSRPCLW